MNDKAKKIKTATITFHASHNYGSMLQAYALQQIILRMGFENEIINLRTQNQKNVYRNKNDFKITGLKSFLKKILMIPFRKQINLRFQLFENFLSQKLSLTKEYNTIEEIKQDCLNYDCYISGGDQIWNTLPIDFDWSYYLSFVNQEKKISYAASMGPTAFISDDKKELVYKYLAKYQHISVREEGTASKIKSFLNTPVSIDLDPTLLLTKGEWFHEIPDKPLIKGKYILLYAPSYRKEVYDIAKFLSKKLHLQVVVTILDRHVFYYNFKIYSAVGPLEFLNLLKYSDMLISGSFHGLVFATLFHIPFWGVNADKDNRMATFLKDMHLENRSISLNDCMYKSQIVDSINFDMTDQILKTKRIESILNLKKSIEN